MPTVEERLAYLEGRVEEHGRGIDGLGEASIQFTHRMDGLDLKIDRFREELGARIDAVDLKIDRLREELGARIDAVDLKIDRLREELGARIGAVDDRSARSLARGSTASNRRSQRESTPSIGSSRVVSTAWTRSSPGTFCGCWASR